MSFLYIWSPTGITVECTFVSESDIILQGCVQETALMPLRAVLSFTWLQSYGLSSFTTRIMLSLPTLFFCFCYPEINSKVEGGRKAIQGKKTLWWEDALISEDFKAMSGNRGQGLSHQWHQYKQGFIGPCKNFSLYPMCNGKWFKYLITFNVSNSVFQKDQRTAKKYLKETKA